MNERWIFKRKSCLTKKRNKIGLDANLPCSYIYSVSATFIVLSLLNPFQCILNLSFVYSNLFNVECCHLWTLSFYGWTNYKVNPYKLIRYDFKVSYDKPAIFFILCFSRDLFKQLITWKWDRTELKNRRFETKLGFNRAKLISFYFYKFRLNY